MLSPMKFRLLLPSLAAVSACLLASAPTPVLAQDTSPRNSDDEIEDSDDDGVQGFWECETPGGNFIVKLSDITSVSKHTYVVDGAARVYEVTVGTRGPMVGRFYYVEPVETDSPLAIGKITLDRLQNLAERATERTGTEEVWSDVVKNYPDTTHAKTAEYRLTSIDSIHRIYAHLYKVWALLKGKTRDNKVVAE